jgi:GNAT superfamily N-acetyltransferase
VTLPDGTPAIVRPIRPDGGPVLAERLQYLSPQSAYQRFLAAKSFFSDEELEYLTRVDGVNHLALVLAVSTPEADEPVAVARCVRDPRDPETAEVAIAVIDAWQRRGVGTILLSALARRAWAVGIRRWQAFFLAENRGVRRLLEREGRALSERWVGDGVVEAVYELAPQGSEDQVKKAE